MTKDAFYTDAQGRVRIIPGGGDHRPRPKETRTPSPPSPSPKVLKAHIEKTETRQPERKDDTRSMPLPKPSPSPSPSPRPTPAPQPKTEEPPLDKIVKQVLEATLLALKAWQQNPSGQQSLRIVALTPQQSLTLHYSPAQQAYQVQASPSDAGKPWQNVVANHPQALPGTQQLLQALEQATQRPIQVVAKPFGLPNDEDTAHQPASQPQVYQHTSTAPPMMGGSLPASRGVPQSPQLPLPNRGQRVEQSPQGGVSRSWLDRVVFPSAQAGGVPNSADQGYSLKDLVEFRGLAYGLKQQETLHRQDPSKGLDSVEALEVMVAYAANVTKNNPKHFVELMSEVLLGQETNTRTLGTRIRITPRILFGDLGMHPIYQDDSSMQMYHFWAYVHIGYFYPKDIAKTINYTHEVIEPPVKKIVPLPFLSSTGTIEDYRLSGVGYNLGQALAKGHITPKQLLKIINGMKLIDRILRTDDYRPFPDSEIPKEL